MKEMSDFIVLYDARNVGYVFGSMIDSIVKDDNWII